MARPRCSRKEPKRLRSSGAIVRRLSMSTRAGADSGDDLVCASAASGRVPITMPVEPATAATEACFRKDRLEAEKDLISVLLVGSPIYRRDRGFEKSKALQWLSVRGRDAGATSRISGKAERQ